MCNAAVLYISIKILYLYKLLQLQLNVLTSLFRRKGFRDVNLLHQLGGIMGDGN